MRKMRLITEESVVAEKESKRVWQVADDDLPD